MFGCGIPFVRSFVHGVATLMLTLTNENEEVNENVKDIGYHAFICRGPQQKDDDDIGRKQKAEREKGRVHFESDSSKHGEMREMREMRDR